MKTKIILGLFLLSFLSFSCGSELWCSDVFCTSTKKNLIFFAWKNAPNYEFHKNLWEQATNLTKNVYQRSNTNQEVDCESRKDICLRYTNDQEQAYSYQIEDMITGVAKPTNWLEIQAYVMEVYGTKVQKKHGYDKFLTECPVIWPALTGIDANPKTYKNEFGCGHVFVIFHQPACTHCKKIKAFWNALVSHYRRKCLKFVYFKCEKKEELDICYANGAYGFPTINFYRDGNVTEEYDGNESMAEFKEFLDGQLAIPAQCSSCPDKSISVENLDVLN